MEKLPGHLYSAVTSIDPTKPAKILPVASSHIVFVGSDINHEGLQICDHFVKYCMGL